MKREITLLSEEQVFGRSRIKIIERFGTSRIEVIERLGTKCVVTDFAILLGVHYERFNNSNADVEFLKRRTGWWYLSSSNGVGNVVTVPAKSGPHDLPFYNSADDARDGGIRPVIPMSSIRDILDNAVRNEHGILEVEYGEYPQYAVEASLGEILEKEFTEGRLKRTGKTYTTDSVGVRTSKRFSPLKYEEFEYKGKKYVRVRANYAAGTLTNGTIFAPYNYRWIEVSPITWYVDEKAKLLISKMILASGIRFCDHKQYRGDFKATDMYMFLNKYFAKDIVPSAIYELSPEEQTEHEERLRELMRIDEFMRKKNEETERSIKNLERLRKELRQMGNTPQQRTPEILDELEERKEIRPH